MDYLVERENLKIKKEIGKLIGWDFFNGVGEMWEDFFRRVLGYIIMVIEGKKRMVRNGFR